MITFNKSVAIFDDHYVWLDSISLWCKCKYGFNKIYKTTSEDELYNYCLNNKNNVDVIILDFYNGNKNTLPLLKKLKKINPNFLIIVVSANFISDEEVLDTKEMLKALEGGANRVCVKDINKLEDIIISHLEFRDTSMYNYFKNKEKDS
jgi:DNA-binding NarL/FixJ family response regulator